MLSHFPGGDQVTGAAPPGVGDQIIGPGHLPECSNALPAIVAAVVDRFDDLRILEDQGGFEKVDFPPSPILPTLALIP
jgi:hypothetical protein